MCEEVYRIVANNMKYYRILSEMNQANLAAKLGLTQGEISLYERMKRFPTLDMMGRYAAFFRVDLETFMFKDQEKYGEASSKRKNRETVDYLPRWCEKCCNRTYYLYFLGIGGSIRSAVLKIGKRTGDRQAPATLLLREKSGNRTLDGMATADESYLYCGFHRYSDDEFMHITFYYYRMEKQSTYYGGLGLMQSEEEHLPVANYFVISLNEIGKDKYARLSSYLKVKSLYEKSGRAKSVFCEDGILRLTKQADKATFNWMQQNIGL